MTNSHLELAQQLAARYSTLPQVEAVALGGSLTGGTADDDSDIDLYVCVQSDIPRSDRAKIVSEDTDPAAIDNSFWGPGDEWRDVASGIHVDVMFWHLGWIEEQLDRVLRRHGAWVGYSTSFWHTVRVSRCLFDRSGWFQELQQQANQPYPEPLVLAIIANNYPILRRNESAYLHQLEKAIARRDLVSVNHRVAAFLASYFDILFAINRLPHPGEKRILAYAEKHCARLPSNMRGDVEELIRATAQPDERLLAHVHTLVDNLDDLLRAEGLYPL